MKLYVFPVAPNPTRVRLFLAEKAESGANIDLPEVMVSLMAGEQKTPEHLVRNPLGKLPVLELDDGSFLTESTAIIEYLEERHPKPALIGSTPLERAAVRELDRLADVGVLMSLARIVHATNSPLGLPPVPDVARDARRGLPHVLRVLDDRLADGRPFLAGDHPSIADCTLQAALQFGRVFDVDVDLPNQLARWDADYRKRAPARTVLVG